MKRFLAKIWVPLLLVTIAAIQSFGIDASRSVGFRRLTDSLAHNNLADTTSLRDSIIPAGQAADSTHADSAANDSTINLILTARDTIKIPDSLKLTDPFKYRYYIAIKDSTTRMQVRDSLLDR